MQTHFFDLDEYPDLPRLKVLDALYGLAFVHVYMPSKVQPYREALKVFTWSPDCVMGSGLSSSVRDHLFDAHVHERFFYQEVEQSEAFTQAFFYYLSCLKIITEAERRNTEQSGDLLLLLQNSPVTWDYFKKRVCSLRLGELPPTVDSLFQKHRPTPPETLASLPTWERMQQKARDESDRNRERAIIQEKTQLMERMGFPYSPTHEEYLRYLKTNFSNMQIGGVTISLEDILKFVIPWTRDCFGNMHELYNVHTYIVGRSGCGKTVLLKGIFGYFRKHSKSVVVIDPHGDLADELAYYGDELTYKIAPHEKRFVINPFDIEDKSEQNRELVAQEITALIGELVEDSGLSRLMTTIIFPIVSTLLKLDYADFRMLSDCINPKTGKERLKSLRSHVDPHLLGIWGELEGDTYDTSKQSVYNRLQSLLNYRLVAQTLCGRDDFTEALKRLENNQNPKQLKKHGALVISLPIPTIGEAVAVTLGRFIMTRLQIWAKRRQSIPEQDRFPVHLIVDEFHNFVSYATAQTLDQFGRKFGLFMILAHQHIQQLTDREIRGSVLANTRNKIAGMSNNETRQAIQKETGIGAQEVEDLKPGHFMAKLGENTPTRFYVRRVNLAISKKKYYIESKNGADLLDGWDGLDEEEATPTKKAKSDHRTKDIPKPKFDL